MTQPVLVGVFALDPMLQAGTESVLFACPQIRVTRGRADARPRVALVVVDRFGRAERELLRTVRGESPRPAAVLVARELTPGEALHAFAAGAGVLLRRAEADADRLARAVFAADRGERGLPPDLLEPLADSGAQDGAEARAETPADARISARTGPRADPRTDARISVAAGTAPDPASRPGGGLTGRERAVLRLVADGCDTREIATRLAYSQRTVTTVVHDVTRRFGLRNRSHAVAYALREGLL